MHPTCILLAFFSRLSIILPLSSIDIKFLFAAIPRPFIFGAVPDALEDVSSAPNTAHRRIFASSEDAYEHVHTSFWEHDRECPPNTSRYNYSSDHFAPHGQRNAKGAMEEYIYNEI
jgi:hypothetical protein